jgi:hypothetical protein
MNTRYTKFKVSIKERRYIKGPVEYNFIVLKPSNQMSTVKCQIIES